MQFSVRRTVSPQCQESDLGDALLTLLYCASVHLAQTFHLSRGFHFHLHHCIRGLVDRSLSRILFSRTFSLAFAPTTPILLRWISPEKCWVHPNLWMFYLFLFKCIYFFYLLNGIVNVLAMLTHPRDTRVAQWHQWELWTSRRSEWKRNTSQQMSTIASCCVFFCFFLIETYFTCFRVEFCLDASWIEEALNVSVENCM